MYESPRCALLEVSWPPSTRVELNQIVLLERAPQQRMFASTWERNGTGITSRAQVAEIRNRLKDLVDKFINDYLAENRPDGRDRA